MVSHDHHAMHREHPAVTPLLCQYDKYIDEGNKRLADLHAKLVKAESRLAVRNTRSPAPHFGTLWYFPVPTKRRVGRQHPALHSTQHYCPQHPTLWFTAPTPIGHSTHVVLLQSHICHPMGTGTLRLRRLPITTPITPGRRRSASTTRPKSPCWRKWTQLRHHT